MIANNNKGRTICGGAVPTGPDLARRRASFAPTLIVDVDTASEIAQEEIFGPLLIVNSFADEDHAVALASGTAYALLAAVWTRDRTRAHRLAAEIEAGQVYVNTYGAGGGVELPFGGFKKSSYDREKGYEALDTFPATKTVVVRRQRVSLNRLDRREGAA